MDYCNRYMVCVSLEQLVPNLRDKTRYFLHSPNLQLYVQVGMRQKNIHGGAPLRPESMDGVLHSKNIKLRKQGKTTFDQDLTAVNALAFREMAVIWNIRAKHDFSADWM